MKPSIKRLQKFFRQEANTDYQDKAVVGGLSSILDEWIILAQQDQLPEVIIKAVSSRLRDYHRLNPDSRKIALKGLWTRIKKDLKDQFKDDSSRVKIDKKENNIETDKEKIFNSFENKVKNYQINKEKKETKIDKNTFHRVSNKPILELDQNVTNISGIGPKNAEKLSRLGIYTIKDLLYHFPRRYDDYSNFKTINRLEINDIASVLGIVKNVISYNGRSGKKVTEVIIQDGTGILSAIWFNQPWIRNSIKKNDEIVIAGKIDLYLGKKVINNPEYEKIEEENLNTGRILPVYNLTSRLSQQWLRKQIFSILNEFSPKIEETLTEEIIDTIKSIYLSDAVYQLHFPEIEEIIPIAKKRILFDELFFMQLSMMSEKAKWAKRIGTAFIVQEDYIDEFSSNLPFTLTNAQKKAMQTIEEDLSSEIPMNRLIQGDVGSGKTIVAAYSIGICIQNNFQSAIMAPTSILADQHYKSMVELLVKDFGILNEDEIALLVGSTSKSEKDQIYKNLQNGTIKLVIGTHALIQDNVNFNNLQLAIIDEQHRFGVNQRSSLRNKGNNVNVLVMTATPIPRSLALTLYGDLNVTIIDELPADRIAVETYLVTPRERERIYAFIEKQISEGNQAYIVVPLVEESDSLDYKSAVKEFENLSKKIFYKNSVGLIHGKMSSEEKEKIMYDFKNGDIDVLVSTTVIEVGVDVPNATVMMIDGAERFGLAQLHQLRGRVGRGNKKSYCVLVSNKNDVENNERLKIMEKTSDGFVLAEKDLEMRGAGDFYGVQQSGFSKLQLLSLLNLPLIEESKEIAKKVFDDDPSLEKKENLPIKKAYEKYLKDNLGERS